MDLSVIPLLFFFYLMIRLPPRSTLLPYTTLFLFFFNDTATTEIYTLSLHDALPISSASFTRRARPSIITPFSFEMASVVACADPIVTNAKPRDCPQIGRAYV